MPALVAGTHALLLQKKKDVGGRDKPGMTMGRGFDQIPVESRPRHQRGVDHVRHALAADRADGEVDVLEPELVSGDELEREALRRQLLQGKLAGLVAVSARALHGDELHGELLEREVRERRELALRDDYAGLALERLDA